ncbi:MAG: hypothetical protein OEZ58_22095 [Gammaproteobacteria bacterium]|nr:hypothetical protein [Gammaproteobacteria bacterium]MDH5731684.1 hypothetical protein [Gammaproteobacteria bacterium]
MNYLIRFSLLVFFMFFVGQAQAGLFTWETTVTADNTNTGLPESTHISEPTLPACDSARNAAYVAYATSGIHVNINAPACTSAGRFEFERLVFPKEIFPWPWPWPGPWCLSCPYINFDSIHVLFPDHVERASELVKQYRIEEYNKALFELQMKFDLESFDKEMANLEMKSQLKQ